MLNKINFKKIISNFLTDILPRKMTYSDVLRKMRKQRKRQLQDEQQGKNKWISLNKATDNINEWMNDSVVQNEQIDETGTHNPFMPFSVLNPIPILNCFLLLIFPVAFPQLNIAICSTDSLLSPLYTLIFQTHLNHHSHKWILWR